MDDKRRDKANKKVKLINSRFTKLLIFIIIVIILIFAVKMLFIKDKLTGSWTTDGNTVYTFDGKGEGYLTTSISKYKFTYKIKRNVVYIDFKVEKANDSDYEFSVKNNKLTLKGINKTTGSYTLNKQ